MPIPLQRSEDSFRPAMQDWLQRKLNVANVSVFAESTPQGVGNANETILFTAEYDEGAGRASRDLVVRVAPTGFRVMLEPRFMETMQLQKSLAEKTDLPVPKVVAWEYDPDILGAPFYVMEKISGRTPTDNPSYNLPETWVGQLSEGERARLWRNGVEAMASIHRTELKDTIDWPFPSPAPGQSGLDMEIDYWDRFSRWAGEGLVNPMTLEVRKWLEDNRPEPVTAFGWGDARLENLMYDDNLNCVAIMDWEMAQLGGPLMDLGWWLLMSRMSHHSQGMEKPLPGLGDRADTIALWEDTSGLSALGVDWFEVFAGYRMIAFADRYIGLAKGTDSHWTARSRTNHFALQLVHDLFGFGGDWDNYELEPWPDDFG